MSVAKTPARINRGFGRMGTVDMWSKVSIFPAVRRAEGEAEPVPQASFTYPRASRRLNERVCLVTASIFHPASQRRDVTRRAKLVGSGRWLFSEALDDLMRADLRRGDEADLETEAHLGDVLSMPRPHTSKIRQAGGGG